MKSPRLPKMTNCKITSIYEYRVYLISVPPDVSGAQGLLLLVRNSLGCQSPVLYHALGPDHGLDQGAGQVPGLDPDPDQYLEAVEGWLIVLYFFKLHFVL